MKPSPFLILACLLSLSLTSCIGLVEGMAKRKTSVEKGGIPPNFGSDNSTLICIITGENGYDKHLKKAVIERYHGKYVFAVSKELDFRSDKYLDRDEYRYVFDYNTIAKQQMEPPYYSYSVKTYFVLDRKTGTKYANHLTSSYWAKLVKGYMFKLEEERLKHQ